MTKDNNLLGTFDLSGIPPAPRGVPQIEVTFDLGTNGILNVSARDNSSGNIKNIVIKNDKVRLSKEEIDRMVNEAEKYKVDDEKQQERITSHNQLESYVFGVKQAEDECEDKLSESDKNAVKSKCQEAINWLDNNTLAKKEEYQHKLSELQKECVPFMTQLHEHNQPSSNCNTGPQVD